MINIPASMLLSLPQGAATGRTTALPFPNGSLLPAQIMQRSDGGTATLQVGNQQFQAQLPSQLPQGNLWILLLERNAPAQFRLLSEQQAATMLASRLAEQAASPEKQALLQAKQEWPAPQQQTVQQQQLQMHPSASGNSLLITDPDDESSRGMIQKEEDEAQFTLHGRIDLDHLGSFHFALHKATDAPYRLSLRATESKSLQLIHASFQQWIQDHQKEEATAIQAELSHGSEPIIKPRLGPGAVA